ncbi:MAG TPA: VWA domain-containing protein [Chthonomonadales bacterium]|nr:VWA domain-containing protein [Chthonomonadales bacterium]
MSEIVPLEEAVEFAENPEPRCPCVLLLDTSGSMEGPAIAALNEGLRLFKEELVKDPLSSRRVEVAVVEFNSSVRVLEEFTTVDEFEPPLLAAHGTTHMGTAIHKALDLLQARKAQYRAAGIAYYRPWLFLITDGAPQGEPEEIVASASTRVREEEASRRIAFFAVGVEEADMQRLASIAVRAPVKLTGLNFGDLFVWLSASMQRVSHSRTDEQVALPPPGWAAV